MNKKMQSKLIAPCGINCSVCLAHLREKNKCPGCRIKGQKPVTRIKCRIKNCSVISNNHWKFCSDKCGKFPCRDIKKLDRRYRTKYKVSPAENLANIKEHGIKNFIESEKKKWIKKNKILCMHNRKYYL